MCHPGLACQVLTDFKGFGRTGLVYARIRTAMGGIGPDSACDGHHGNRNQEPRPVDSYLAHAARRPNVREEFVEDLG